MHKPMQAQHSEDLIYCCIYYRVEGCQRTALACSLQELCLALPSTLYHPGSTTLINKRCVTSRHIEFCIRMHALSFTRLHLRNDTWICGDEILCGVQRACVMPAVKGLDSTHRVQTKTARLTHIIEGVHSVQHQLGKTEGSCPHISGCFVCITNNPQS